MVEGVPASLFGWLVACGLWQQVGACMQLSYIGCLGYCTVGQSSLAVISEHFAGALRLRSFLGNQYGLHFSLYV